MKARNLTLITLAALSGAALAAEGDSDTLDAVTVTASPLNEDEHHIAQPLTVLQGPELRRKLEPTIGETLANKPGISSTYFGAGASRPIIRGLGGSRVRILENGIGSMDVSNLSPDHAVSVDPLAATQIEVLKGPATLLYGSGASGGVVNVVTNRIASQVPDTPTGQLHVRYGTATEERAASFAIDAPLLDRFVVHLDGSARESEDYDIPGFGSISPKPGEQEGTLANSALKDDNLTGGASYISELGYLGFAVGHLSDVYDIPGEGAKIDLKQTRYDINGELKKLLPGVEKIKVRLGHNDYKHQEIEPGGEIGTSFLNDEFEGRLELLHKPLGAWYGAAGLQIMHRDFEAIGEEALTPPLTAQAEGLFVYEHRDLNDWHLELGGRVEHQLIEPDNGDPSAEHLVYSLSGGAIREFAPGYTAGVSLTRAQRAPSLEELFNNGPHAATATFERGDRDLGAETANDIDLTLRKRDGRWTWQVNLFANYIEDYIFGQVTDEDGDGVADLVDENGILVPAGTDDALLRVDYAQHDAIFYGAELETTVGLWEGPWGRIDARLFGDAVRAQLTNGDNLPRIAPLRIGGGFDYRHGRWLGTVETLHAFDQTHNAALEAETDGHTLLEASASYTYSTQWADYSFSLRGTNLLDEEIRLATSFLKDLAPLPGRSAMLNLRVTF